MTTGLLNTTAVLALILVTGCSLAPDYKTPTAADPKAFKEAQANVADPRASWAMATPAADQSRGEWWRIFNDPELDKLIRSAAGGNQSLAAMAARVDQARSVAAIEKSALFPAIDANASYTRQLQSAAGLGFAANFEPQSVYGAGLGLSYELDVFGRARNASRAAKADALGSAAQYQSMLLTLQADVAQMYYLLRGQDAEIALLEKTLALRDDGLKILRKRREVGVVTDLDIAQNVVDVENTRAQLQELQQQRRQNENALAVLLGSSPSDFHFKSAPLTAQVPAVPANLPAQVLQRRPDITAAQYNLMAANARIGVARAAFFPSLSLTGSAGYQSESLGSLFDWSSHTWAVGPLLSLPIFQGGRIVAENDRVRARYEESVADYRQAVLRAFEDVENALTRLKTGADQAQSYGKAKEAADQAARIAARRYETGDSDYLEEINARQGALNAARASIRTQANRLANTVQLIRALGGDWSTPVVSAPVAKTPEKKAQPEKVNR